MSSTLTKSFKIDEEQYARWERFMDDSVENASLSQLVRVAVHAYIRGETQPTEQPIRAQKDERQAELLEELRQMKAGYQQINKEMRGQLRYVSGHHWKTLKLALLEMLPEPPDTEDDPMERVSSWAVSEQHLAKRLDSSERRIDAMLSELRSEYGQVERVTLEDSGVNYWYVRA